MIGGITGVTPIRVLLVDDQQLVREGLRSMLQLDDVIMVVGEACSGEEALEKDRDLKPDVILMDVRMPGMGGIEAARQLKAQGSQARVIILTVYADQYLMQAVEAGVVGYLLKDIEMQDMVRAVKAVHDGQTLFPSQSVRTAFKLFPTMNQVRRGEALTPRQFTILRLMASGGTNNEIAQRLHLSRPTIKREASAIFEKLGAVDRVQAVSIAYDKNLL